MQLTHHSLMQSLFVLLLLSHLISVQIGSLLGGYLKGCDSQSSHLLFIMERRSN
jgi:hypothetical protein